jgi:histidinol dehydrogenase
MKLIKKNIFTEIAKIQSQNSQLENETVRKKLLSIEKEVIKSGDLALNKFTKEFDGVVVKKIKVSPEEIDLAYKNTSKRIILALKHAKKNLEGYCSRQLPKSWYRSPGWQVKYGQKFTAIENVGLYVPGGRAPYPSTVLMNAVPAKTAGVKNIIMVTPPNKDGQIPSSILVAAHLAGVTEIYKVGGSQAIFALAYGTQSIPKVDKIVGPGNIYVTLAKQMVYGKVDIDKPAGPSEALIYFNQAKYLKYAAADFIAQLEHDPDASAIAISEDETLLKKLSAEVLLQIEACSRKEIIKKALANSYLFLTQDQNESMALINACASEHLVLLVDKAEKLVKDIKNAGAIFIGPFTPVTLGDYYAGPNHVLPTSGTARFASPLGVMDFFKYSSLLSYSQGALKKASQDLAILTDLEGFSAHNHAAQIRL